MKDSDEPNEKRTDLIALLRLVNRFFNVEISMSRSTPRESKKHRGSNENSRKLWLLLAGWLTSIMFGILTTDPSFPVPVVLAVVRNSSLGWIFTVKYAHTMLSRKENRHPCWMVFLLGFASGTIGQIAGAYLLVMLINDLSGNVSRFLFGGVL